MFSSLLEASNAVSSPGLSQAKSPAGLGLSGEGAAALLAGFGAVPYAPNDALARAHDDEYEEEEEVAPGPKGVSRKDKSLGLLCDNFLQLFASGSATAVELESVASTLGVGRRRIYDIVNVLESLDVVQKDRASAYTWLGISKLPQCVDALSKAKPLVPLLVDEPGGAAAIAGQALYDDDDDAAASSRRHSMDGKPIEGRKEKSIRELSTKVCGLLLTSLRGRAQRPTQRGCCSCPRARPSPAAPAAAAARPARATRTLLFLLLRAPAGVCTLPLSHLHLASASPPPHLTAATLAPSRPLSAVCVALPAVDHGVLPRRHDLARAGRALPPHARERHATRRRRARRGRNEDQSAPRGAPSPPRLLTPLSLLTPLISSHLSSPHTSHLLTPLLSHVASPSPHPGAPPLRHLQRPHFPQDDLQGTFTRLLPPPFSARHLLLFAQPIAYTPCCCCC